MRVWLAFLIVLLLAVSTVMMYGSSSGVADYSVTVFVLVGLFGVMVAGFLFVGKKVNTKADMRPFEDLALALGAQPKRGFLVTDSIMTGTYKDYGYVCQYIAPSAGRADAKPMQFVIRLESPSAVRLCMEIRDTDERTGKKAFKTNKLATGDDEFDRRIKLMGQDSETNRSVLSNERFRSSIKQLFSHGTSDTDLDTPPSSALEIGDLSFGAKYVETTIYGASLGDISPGHVRAALNNVIKIVECAAEPR